MKNLQELGASPFPYIVPVLPHPLPAKLVKGEHFVLTDLLKLILGSSSQADYALLGGEGQKKKEEEEEGWVGKGCQRRLGGVC